MRNSLAKENHFIQKIAILIFTLVFVLYGNSIRNDFSIDDSYVTVTTPEKPNNPRIEKGIRGIPRLFTSHYAESAYQSFEYRPLTLVTFAIEYQFFGSNPHINHFINVLIYAFTCVLLFTILFRLLKNYHVVFPFLIILLFIVHPIHTEVVDNIKCRDELLAFFFGISSLHFFLRNVETKKWIFILFGILCLFMSFLCKQTAFLFIAFIPLTIYFFTPVNLKRTLVMVAIIIGIYFTYVFLKDHLIHSSPVQRDFAFFENPLYFEPNFLERIPIAFYTLGYYIKLLILPYSLCCYYGYNTIPMAEWTSPLFIISFIFYLIIVIYALVKFPQKSILSYGILVYLIGIFPFSNIIKPAVGIIAERFIYFASFGFCIAVAYLLLSFFKIDIISNSKFKLKNLKLPFKFIITTILVTYSFLTISRNDKWKNILTLYRNDVQQNKNSFMLHYIIAKTISPQLNKMSAGYKKDILQREVRTHFKQAAELLRIGLEKYKTDYYTMTTLGALYCNSLNDVDAAIPYLKKSLSINPDYYLTQI